MGKSCIIPTSDIKTGRNRKDDMITRQIFLILGFFVGNKGNAHRIVTSCW